MKWTEEAWHQAAPILESIKAQPFIAELMNGTLDAAKFKFYISQDAIYLEHFGRALALIAGRADQVGHVLEFIRFAEGAIVVENALHGDYFRNFNIESGGLIAPGCHHYTSFLLKEASLSPVEVAMASVLPCFWIYKYVGDYISLHQQKIGNPYQSWIDTYAGEEFGLLVKKAIDICDEVAERCTESQRQRMTNSFLFACQMEWTFWDAAYQEERWPFGLNN
jgi:thiaminase/transcriptional activator TenA